jgi:hypothetical protein
MKHKFNADENLDNALGDVMDILKRQEQMKREKQYQAWCNQFASPSSEFGRKLKGGYIAGVELQPDRWIQHSLDLIGSRKGFGTIQLSDGVQGADFRAFLPYPVFQIGVEIFLKGMWLYQHDECRKIQSDTYIAEERRNSYFEKLKSLSKEHDLLKLIQRVQAIEVYSKDAELLRFLKILGGVSKKFYLPVTNSQYRWADERYPKRFFNDSLKRAGADSFKSYPDHWLISRLFAEAAERLEFIWTVQTND